MSCKLCVLLSQAIQSAAAVFEALFCVSAASKHQRSCMQDNVVRQPPPPPPTSHMPPMHVPQQLPQQPQAPPAPLRSASAGTGQYMVRAVVHGLTVIVGTTAMDVAFPDFEAQDIALVSRSATAVAAQQSSMHVAKIVSPRVVYQSLCH